MSDTEVKIVCWKCCDPYLAIPICRKCAERPAFDRAIEIAKKYWHPRDAKLVSLVARLEAERDNTSYHDAAGTPEYEGDAP